MGGRMSRNKGIRGEREIITLLQPIVRQVHEAAGALVPVLQRNTLQSDKGGHDIAGLHWMAPEVKHCQTLNLKDWWRQTLRQCGHTQTPVLFYRRNNEEWRVMMEVTCIVGDTVMRMPAILNIHEFLRYFRARVEQEVKQ